MKPITAAQLKMLHVLLNQLDLMERKADFVYSFSHGRTESSRELTLTEAKEFIEYLKRSEETQRLINSIWHLAYEMNIISGSGSEQNWMNAAKLDMFCKNRGTMKKNLREQSYTELKKTHRQFEAMYKKHLQKQNIAQTLAKLEREMKECIAVENYEKCAVLKREIERLK